MAAQSQYHDHCQLINPFDLSDELVIERFRGGVRLAKPANDFDTSNSIRAFRELKASVYFVDTKSTILSINDAGAELNGLVNLTDMNGKNVKHFLNNDFSGRVFEHDKAVIESGKIRVFEESGKRQDEGAIQSVAVRFPWYHGTKLVGIYGICASVESHSLLSFAETMDKLIRSGLVNGSDISQKNKMPQLALEQSYYSKREIQVIELMIKGESTKEIANILFISKRTVEHHIENIKNKANCKTRYELMYKFSNINNGLNV